MGELDPGEDSLTGVGVGGFSPSGLPRAVEQAGCALCLLGELALFNFLSGYEVDSKTVRENRERRGEKKQTRFRGNLLLNKDRTRELGPWCCPHYSPPHQPPARPLSLCVRATVPGIAHLVIDSLTFLQGTQTAFLT